MLAVGGSSSFPSIGLAQNTTAPRTRTYSGPLGALKLSVRTEGGHYTFVQVDTDQMGESRMDRNVKKFFVGLHRTTTRRTPSLRTTDPGLRVKV